MPRLSHLPGPMRLAGALFAVSLLGFMLLAQVNLWVQDGDGKLPGPDAVLAKYHGDAKLSRLAQVLDPERLPEEDPHAMWLFLGADDEEIAANWARVETWLDEGATREGFGAVEEIFLDPVWCASCHGPDGEKADLPFTSYADVAPLASDGRMPLAPLLISAHNHAFGFAIAALLISVLLVMTGVPRALQGLLVLALFVGPMLDIGGWFLTRSLGAPFHWMVMAGGGMFGSAALLAVLLILRESCCGKREPTA